MGDYISRDAAIQAIKDIDENAGARGSGFTDPERIMRDSAFYALEAVPAADVRPVVRGKWISEGDGYHWTYNCSICGWKDGYQFNERHNYCPNCGADMRKVVESDKVKEDA